MRLPVQTAEKRYRGLGAPVVDIACQLLVDDAYRPPPTGVPAPSNPPQTTNWVPVQTAGCQSRADGAPAALTELHVFWTGSYFIPSP